MTEYTELQIAILTMPTEDLNRCAGIVTDWADRLHHGWFEDDETGEDRHYEMPDELRPHLEVLGGVQERVAELLGALDNFGGYFPTDGEVSEGDFLAEFYESEEFANAPSTSTIVDAESLDVVIDSARAIEAWAVRMLRVKDDLPADIATSLRSLLGLHFWVRGLVETVELAAPPSAHYAAHLPPSFPPPLVVYLVAEGIPTEILDVRKFDFNVENPSRRGAYAPEIDVYVDYDPSNPEHRALLAAGAGGIVTIRVAILDPHGSTNDCREMDCTVERYDVYWGRRFHDGTTGLQGDFDLEVVGEARIIS